MADKETTPAGERIAKRIARAGLCSRRDAERWIADGRVAVDGEVLTSPAFTVTAASRITVDGQPLPDAEAPRLFRLHKPTGVLTAARDPDGRKTIADLIPAELPRLMPVGRLDLNSEGLLLLTNDGGLKRRLELPATGWQRRYRVRVHGAVDEAKLDALKRGITIEGFDYGPIEAVLERTVGSNAWLQVALPVALKRWGADASRTTSAIVVALVTARAGSTVWIADRTEVASDDASTSPLTATFMRRHRPPIGLASPWSLVSEYGE
jgi:23S rRNA pseudouridine2605 synthase